MHMQPAGLIKEDTMSFVGKYVVVSQRAPDDEPRFFSTDGDRSPYFLADKHPHDAGKAIEVLEKVRTNNPEARIAPLFLGPVLTVDEIADLKAEDIIASYRISEADLFLILAYHERKKEAQQLVIADQRPGDDDSSLAKQSH